MPDNSNDNIALLIDADNAPASKIDFIIAELASHGIVNIRKAYGNWKKPGLSGWEKVLHDFAIQPIQHFVIRKVNTDFRKNNQTGLMYPLDFIIIDNLQKSLVLVK